MMPGLDAKPLKRSMRKQVRAAIPQEMVPTGVYLPFGGSTAPDGYLLCNGSAVSRRTYAGLFAVIGTTFGVGDGSTTFNVPNLVNRLPIGAGGLYAAGATGGSKDAIVVTHNHTATSAVADTGHAHTGGEYSGSNTLGAGALGVHARLVGAPTAGNTGTTTTGVTVATTVDNSGASGTDANLPPYIASNFIIKT
jgi:microcystin-dependent protein